ncbi:MAG: aspartate 4-decarboxylase, partial [Muribaculaceae bacterium]|nr:aspartate 4-decarboxylase [Muribaculaceae bacterium]
MDNPLSRDYEQKLSQMSPFEIKNELIRLAQEDSRKSCATYLNAGRGNPNWTASDAREAFLLLGYFALDECRRVHSEAPGIAGSPSKKGIADRFEAFLAKQPVTEGSSLLKEGYRYVVDRLKADRDELILEWADGITGDHYPTPPRILNYTEQIIRPYLAQEMGNRAEGGGRD